MNRRKPLHVVVHALLFPFSTPASATIPRSSLRRWQPNGYHYIHPPKMRSICRRWFKSCAASMRTNSSTVCHPRTSWTP
jgi:hypothetical protein